MPATDDIVRLAKSQVLDPPSDRFDTALHRVPLVTLASVVLVRALSTANVAPTGSPTIDGWSTWLPYDPILLTNQTIPAETGVWLWQSGAWVRSDNPQGAGTLYSVIEGTANKGLWRIESDGTFVQLV